eukprot:CAMPEP_0201589000 /NCGR_PEP_ID=MMETSP0190_2-20130828/161598_1 /ASSEMBLY_ACC=CAM_ASM_000263 /TAXON_ID=37353 /ORGANISM="Rosalina sp." /LENGTH=231 /DNA_ID=CAMNT_0048042263 /DNA_START=1 /DNA_END=699 /DNA_ORIENTATION=-
MIINQSMETNYGTQSTEPVDDEYKDVPLQNPYGGRQLRPLPDTESAGAISPDWRQYHHYNHDYTINKLHRLKFKNHRSGSSNNMSMHDMATISTVTKTPSPEMSHNDEEKAYAPSQPGNNPYLLEPKKNSNSHSGSKGNNNNIHHSKSGSGGSSHPNLEPSMHSQQSNHYNHDFEKEYIFAQHLEDTIKSLTKSDQASENDDEFLEQDSFMKIADDNLWHRHGNIKDGYVE